VLRRRPTHTAPRRAGPQPDFQALGRILYAMLTGDTSLITGPGGEWRTDMLFNATRLPLPLSPLQPCLDGLLGRGAQSIEPAEDVVVELLADEDTVPGHTRPAESREAPSARELGKRGGAGQDRVMPLSPCVRTHVRRADKPHGQPTRRGDRSKGPRPATGKSR